MWFVIALALCFQDVPKEDEQPPALSIDQVRQAGLTVGLELSDGELELMLSDVIRNLRNYDELRSITLDNAVVPAIGFSPLPAGSELRTATLAPKPLVYPELERPADLEELAFADIPTLAVLIRARKLSCVELAEMYMDRLERLDRHLHCVISFTRERALAQAAALDAELARGKWRGPLHGIPWGAKDLLATRGSRTTWGAKPFEEQTIDLDATVVRRLDEAGAVLIAKLSLGALAMGDEWFGGKTRTPWNPQRGSSGSSAGSASATAAGGVAFAVGSETLGSIVSPSTRCGNSSLRPTFGRVSRHGAMALSWSMDKLGPICRSARDCAIVFECLRGSDGLDPSVRDEPFVWAGEIDVEGWRVGIPEGAFGDHPERYPVLEELEKLGCELVEVELPRYPVREMLIILHAEAAAAFDELTLDGRDDLLTKQGQGAWPNSFRVARLIPAVEYIRAQRLRTKLMVEFDAAVSGVDVLVHPNYAAGMLRITNLTGHPTWVGPAGFRDDVPTSISFTGQLYDESRLLALAHAWQRATGYHLRHPPMEFLADDE